MYHIARVAIDGFWETHSVELLLFPEVTFLIGQNGTGKTTLINLLAAALTADFRTLDRLPFKKISIHFTGGEKGAAPRIVVNKSKRADRPFELIEYRVKPAGAGSQEVKYSLDDIEEQLVMRRAVSDPRSLREFYRHMSSGLLIKLREIAEVNWLSVHRAPTSDRSREERSYDSAVDQRLEGLSNDLVRFFSTLSQQKDVEVRSFQESIFVSLIAQSELKLENQQDLDKLDGFADAIQNIFQELHVAKDQTEPLIRSFLERARAVKAHLADANKGGFLLDDALLLLDLRRISSVVDRWNKLQERLATVFAPRDKWRQIVNELFRRKTMNLTDSNELQFVSRTGKILTASMLSSGEKQLLILLSETLLQRERPAIFIADEPELSLHVLWQEKLVASLRQLNPSAQLIIATHSPDIVGPLAGHAIDMETLIP
ncbi:MULTISPECIES: AAA family ATPase [unclassified Bradyrhizobium]|uniref:AAA family ATPase n=1 Tax=unclassified Bradyrhizobium TaxID=2631580 RepID=UPI0028EBB094|nr:MULTISPECIES: AAA family ATPase [unclassified Bradyrhizobium]